MHEVPLLARPLCEWTPEEYRAYVKSLYFKRTPKKAPSKRKPFIAKRTKTGKLSLKINRIPPWLSEAELIDISRVTGTPRDDVFLKLKERGGILSSPEEQQKK